MSDQQTVPVAASGSCLHCEAAPALNRFGLCECCRSKKNIRILYIRRRGWTPAFEAHLMRLRRRAEQRLPLFDGPLVVGGPRNGRIHPLHCTIAD